ncbi:membrane glycosyltransferase [Roseimicrobium gellanilyticum]|uniref:Glucans biosynthesis glucosyltransferase H n=1 Tax=Roseimicrobium gellanilyticum TaxID=748857 RepID=A0A366HVJ6_9BACT|nr:glucans biosynthesis glucosyltransferase MdoH [Roseimicrobium gellanilyticum]RBP47584.1 membrane glycosyltransferase [Roseimicrobium gellanilyticum]
MSAPVASPSGSPSPTTALGSRTAQLQSHAGMPSPATSRLRRATFFSFVFVGTVVGIWLMYQMLNSGGMAWYEWGLLVVFIPLYYQLNIGFWTALIGIWMMNRPKPDPLDLFRTITNDDMEAPLGATTAIIVPVYNEDVTRVFEGIRSVYNSLAKTGKLEHYDFFILSDSDDSNKWIEEEAGWLELCRQLNAFGKIFYRKRRTPINRKSGNVSDFCRRWGKRYRYMIVFDADSVMSGPLLVNLVRIMEKNPGIGILQTFPKQIGADTLLGRIMQFAQAFYGPAFISGLSYWQCGEANFWGHNAIIRLAPFIEYCALPPLPEKVPFGGHIMSHDFVEAALMRKAGYAVRLLATDHGSYEEGPPTLIDTLKRDRRWCLGNMQHFWLLFARGWHPISRLNFYHGIMSYVSSPVWLLFLVLGTIMGASNEISPMDMARATFAGQLLLLLTLAFIFMPKIIIMLDELVTGRLFKPIRLRLMAALSSFLDTFIFTLMAPIMMYFHSQFVVKTILGQGVSWVAQRRKLGGGIDWREPILTFGSVTLVGIAWGVAAFFISTQFLLWISPVLLGLILAIPFAITTSSTKTLQRLGLFVTPEELHPPPVLQSLNEHLDEVHARPPLQPELEQRFGLVQVCLDPYVNGLHVSLLRRRRQVEHSREYFRHLSHKLISQGPNSLSKRELTAVLYDPDTVIHLHYELWSSSEETLSPFWKLAIRQYNLVAPNPFTHLLAQKGVTS